MQTRAGPVFARSPIEVPRGQPPLPEWPQAWRPGVPSPRAQAVNVEAARIGTLPHLPISAVAPPRGDVEDVPEIEAHVATDQRSEARQQHVANEHMPSNGSLRTVYLLNFLMVANFTVLMPKTKEYWEALGGDADVGMMLTSMLPLLKAVMAWVFLRLSHTHSMSTVISIMIAGNIVGNFIFALAPLTGSRWTVFVARLILTSHEVQSVPNCYIGRAVGQSYRSEASMYNNAWFAFGFAAGPIIASLLERFAKATGIDGQGVDVFDAETLPGWLMCLVWAMFLAVHIKFFEEPELEAGEETSKNLKQLNMSQWNWVGIVALGITSFVTAMTMSSWEMFTMNMAQDRWGSPLVAGGYLAAVTLVILPVALLGPKLSTVLHDNFGLIVVSFSAFISWGLLFDYFRTPYFFTPERQILYYTMGSICLLASLQLVRGFLDALISKINPTDSKQIVITAGMSIFMLGRGCGGSLGAIFTNYQNIWAGLHMSACFFTAWILAGAWKYLQPWDVYSTSLMCTTPAAAAKTAQSEP